MRLSPFLTRPRPYKKQIAADPQRELVYSLERTLIGAVIYTHCDRGHLEAIIKHACNVYKVKSPRLVISRKEAHAFGWCHEDRIELNASFHGDNVGTLLHELAHWITDFTHEEVMHDLEQHGPEFVGAYADLLDRYKLIPYDAFLGLLDEWNIRIKPVP